MSLVAALKRLGYKVYAPDLPGFGKAMLPDKPWRLADYARWLHEYLGQNDVKQPIIIGHSFGGRLALVYQQLYPKNVRSLILSGTPGFTPVPRKKLLVFIFMAKIGNILFSIPPLSLIKDIVRRWYYYLVGARDFFRAEGVMRETFKNVVAEDLVPAMEAMALPCLLIWGEYDIIVPVAIAEKMSRVIVGSELIVVPEADHGVPFKQPKVFVSYMQKWLQQL